MAFADNTTGGRVIKEGIMPVRITLTDTCNVGDLIGYDGVTSDAWERASASGKVPAQLVAGEKCETSGDTIVCFQMAYVDFGSGSTATAGDMVYVSNTAGRYASTPGSWVAHCVGQCVSATVALIHPSALPFMSYAPTGTGWGGYIRAELESGRTSMDLWGGLRIDVKSIATSVVASDAYGLYIFTQLQSAPVASSSMLRLEDGCATSCGFDTWMSFIGGPDQDPPDYFLTFGATAPTNGAWDLTETGDANTIAGFLLCNMGGSDRYIYLYAIPPAS